MNIDLGGNILTNGYFAGIATRKPNIDGANGTPGVNTLDGSPAGTASNVFRAAGGFDSSTYQPSPSPSGNAGWVDVSGGNGEADTRLRAGTEEPSI
jgi:hypothetical protein